MNSTAVIAYGDIEFRNEGMANATYPAPLSTLKSKPGVCCDQLAGMRPAPSYPILDGPEVSITWVA